MDRLKVILLVIGKWGALIGIPIITLVCFVPILVEIQRADMPLTIKWIPLLSRLGKFVLTALALAVHVVLCDTALACRRLERNLANKAIDGD